MKKKFSINNLCNSLWEIDILLEKSSNRSCIEILSYQDGNVSSWKIQRREAPL